MIRESTISEVTQRIVEEFHPRKVILFGSQARGVAGDESDLDLIVLCDEFNDGYELEAQMRASLRGIPVAIDLMVYTPEEFERERKLIGTVARPASMEGRTMYERAA